jgi:hypothetical protein
MKSKEFKWEAGWSKGKEVYWLDSINQVIEFGTWQVYNFKEENGVLVETSTSRHLYDCLKDENWYGRLNDEEFYDLASHRVPHDFSGL